MLFCNKCGSVMMPKKEKEKKIMVCMGCGNVNKSPETTTLKEIIPQQEELEVLQPDDEKTLPEIEIECNRCKFDKAVYWFIQTRSGDEAETKFYKCLKCKHTWREYD
jgi:transcription factor S